MRRLATLVILQILILASGVRAQTTVGAIPAGTAPISVAVNPITNKIYVANQSSSNVTVIDGLTNSTTTVTTGTGPSAVAVNTVTNRIYVADSFSASVTVIDGATDTVTATVTVGTSPNAVALNPITNKIYVTNGGTNNVTVIDGVTNGTTFITVGTFPQAVAVNQITNKIYVANSSSDTVSVIDGASNSVTTSVTSTPVPKAIAVNPVTNQIYVANGGFGSTAGNVTVIDGATNGATPLAGPSGLQLDSIAVNPVTNKIYTAGTQALSPFATFFEEIDGVSNTVSQGGGIAGGSTSIGVNPITNRIFVASGSSVAVVNGTTTVTVGAGTRAVAVNPVTNKIYVASNGTGTVSVIDGATIPAFNHVTVTAGTGPQAVAANPVTNKIYVANGTSNDITVINGATNTPTTINDPNAVQPRAVGINPITNKIYVANITSNNITVIDGATNGITTIADPTAINPYAVAVNPVTNKIYVPNANSDTVTVINGATNTTATVHVGSGPVAIAINPVTNRIYVDDRLADNISVIDGTTDTVIANVTVGTSPYVIAVNTITNQIYVANSDISANSITVIDGATNATTPVIIPPGTIFAMDINPVTNKVYTADTGGTVTVFDVAINDVSTFSAGTSPQALVVNPVTNKIYVTNNGSSNITVFDGATNFITTVAAGTSPYAIAVNPITNKIYATNFGSGNVTAITEQSPQANPLTTAITPLTFNTTASTTPTFTFTAASSFSPTAPTPNNVLFQIDTWQGPWNSATDMGSGTFQGTTSTLPQGFHVLYAFSTDTQDSVTSNGVSSANSPTIGSISAYGFLISPVPPTFPTATLSSSSISYGSQFNGATSPSQSVTLTNTGTASLNITTVVLGGTNPLDFTLAETCSNSTLIPGANCTVGGTFNPAFDVGSLGATITITDDDNNVAGSTQTVTLSGTGVAIGTANLSTTTLTFTSQKVGTTSVGQTVTLSNSGTADLTITSITPSGDFGLINNNCGALLSPDISCTFDVTFSPTSTGPIVGTVTLVDSALDTPQTVALTGTGVAPVPEINQPSVPVAAVAGGSGFTLTVNGTGFVPGAQVTWNGTGLTTTFVNSQQLTATVPAGNIVSQGTALIRVVNPPSASSTSNVVLFQITSPTAAVTLSRTDMPTDSGPGPVAVGDLNGDGINDLVTVSNGPCTVGVVLICPPAVVSVQLGNGDGTFRSKVEYPTSPGGSAVAIADFNGDGVPDVGVTNTKNGVVTILLGTGAGVLGSPTPYTAGTSPLSIAVGDFNGDGKLDIATANNGDNTVGILLGNGDGTFQSVLAYDVGTTPASVAVGDFNGDGIPDLAVTNENITFLCAVLPCAPGPGSVSILTGVGDGSFGLPNNFATGLVPSSVVAADVNGDGILDLVTSNQGDNTISTLLGNGDGTFQTQTTSPTAASPSSVSVGDFNGDGLLDVAVANQGTPSASVLLGNGNGTFKPHADYPVGNGPFAAAVGDFNGDGRLDLAVTNNTDGTVSILTQNPVLTLGSFNLNFGSQNVGTTSASQSVTLGNAGSAALSLSGVFLDGIAVTDFNLGHNCPVLAPQASCSPTGSFYNGFPGSLPFSNVFYVTAPNGNGDRLVVGTPTGGMAAFIAGINSVPTPSFANQEFCDFIPLAPGMQALSYVPTAAERGGDFSAFNVLLIDPSTGLAVSGGILSPATSTFWAWRVPANAFQAGNFPPGATCTIQVSATPTGLGARSADVSIGNNGATTIQMINLAVTGVVPVASVAPPTLTFPAQLVSTTSAGQTITLSNTGGGPLSIASIVETGDFAITNNLCGAILPALSSCTFDVTFTPTVRGTRTGTVTVTDNSNMVAGSTQTVALNGTGSEVINLGPNSAIVNIDGRADGAQTSDPSQTVWTQPFNVNGNFLTLPVQAGTYKFQIIDPADAATQFPSLTPAQLSQIFTAWTFNAPCVPHYLVFDISATTNSSVPEFFMGARPNGSPCPFQAAYDAAIAGGYGTNVFTFSAPTTLVFAVPDNILSDNGGGVSVLITLVGPVNPVPEISQPLSPPSATPGGAGFTLTVNGTGFVSGATVLWNGISLATTFVNGNQLTATVPAGNIAAAGTASVIVANPSPGGGSSEVVYFHVTNPTPSATLGNASTASINVGSQPRAMTVGDFNGDGIADLAVAIGGANNLAILLGNGDGTFTAAASPATGSNPAQVIAGDFNGDGKLDLAVANQISANVTLLKGNGDGTFTSIYSFTGTGSGPISMAVGDFNQDGNLDIAISNSGSNNVTILLGDGNGTFTDPITMPSTGLSPISIKTGDFNGDGKIDLAVVNGNSSSVSILLGNGDGTFTTAPSSPATGTSPNSLAVGDFNGDGKLDLAVSNFGSNNLTILLGNGDGTFTPTATSPATGTGPDSVRVGDFNGDGILDLAVADNTSADITILLGDGQGGFTPQPSPASVGSGAVSLVVADFNGDGRLDVANVNTTSGSVSVLIQVPTANLSSNSLIFGSQLVGTQSAAQTVTLSNSGSLPLTITSIIPSADFGVTNNCPAPLAVGANCSLFITFTPSTTGVLAGSVTLTDNASPASQLISLSGTGVAPIVALSTNTVPFGNQLVGTTSAAQTVTLSNVGTGPLTIASIVPSGDFAVILPGTPGPTACQLLIGSPLAAGGSCRIPVTFTPTVAGARAGSITITDNNNAVPGSLQTVNLSGTGTVPAVTLAPTSLTFSSQGLGATSAAQPVTLSNIGTGPLNITSISASGDFAVTNTCGGTVAAGANCTLSVTFTPTALGARAGSVTIVDNASTSPQSIPLTGTGVNTQLTATPALLGLPGTHINQTCTPGIATITSISATDVVISSFSISGPFVISANTCPVAPAVLKPGATCAVSITYVPTAVATQTGTLTISSDAVNSPNIVSLTANGLAACFLAPNVPVTNIMRGADSASFTIAHQACSVAGPVKLSCSNQSPATCAFSPDTLTSPDTPSTLTVSNLHALTGDLSFQVHADASLEHLYTGISIDMMDFMMASAAATGNINAGETASYAMAVAPAHGLQGTVSFSCSGAPAGATCTVSPQSVALNGTGSSNVSVKVTTTGRSTVGPMTRRVLPPGTSPLGLMLLSMIAMMAGLLVWTKTRSMAPARMRLATLAAGLIMAMVLSWAACGGTAVTPVSSTSLVTPSGTYTLTVTGTFTATGSRAQIVHNTTLTLTVH